MGNEHEMPRHCFDVRDANELAIDDEGMELPTLEAVPQEAAKSLVSTAKHADRLGRTGLPTPLYGIVAFVLDDESREQQKFQALPPLSFHMHQQMCRDGRESKSANIQERRPSEERRTKQKRCGQDTRN